VFIYQVFGKWGVLGFTILAAIGCFIEFPDYSNPNPKYRRNIGLDPNKHLKLSIALNFNEIIFGCNKKLKVRHLEKNKNGSLESVNRELTFTIPPGIHEGTIFWLKREGNDALDGNPGDLYITFENLPVEGIGMRREGSDIISKLRLTPAQSRHGHRASVKTILGWIDINIPSGVRDGERLIIRDRGLPKFNFRELFVVAAGTCRERRKNLVKHGSNLYFYRKDISLPRRGNHITEISIPSVENHEVD
jgi:DnaJ-class molecular chaperone